MLSDLRPIPMKDRASLLFIERGALDVLDGAFVVVDKTGERAQVPVGGIACILLEPGTRVSHRAVELAARVGCLLTWIGEAGVRIYSAADPGAQNPERLLLQARLATDERHRLKVVRKMYELRFNEPPPKGRNVDQLRGIEGARVKALYQQIATRHGVQWRGRSYNPNDFASGDTPNRCLSAATSCLYGITEAAILASGYSPAIGFIHVGKAKSFVYDIADIVKFDTIVPAAFKVAAKNPHHPEREVRQACRDSFRKEKTLERLIPLIEEVLASAELVIPAAPYGSIPPAIREEREFSP